MNKVLKDLRILIVEDENKNTEILERILVGIGISQIRTSSNTEHAIDLIEAEFPDLILLDLKIPYMEGGVEDSVNSFNIIMDVERINRIHDHQIRIIIISGTTQERGLQKLISRDKSLIQHMFDKGLMGKSPEEFKAELLLQINKVLNYPVKKERPFISLSELRLQKLFPLKSLDKYLFETLNEQIIVPFENIDEKTESNLVLAIIVKCGVVVEYLIDGFSLKISESTKQKFSDFSALQTIKSQKLPETSVKESLLKLTGRKSEWKKEKDKNGNEKKIEYFIDNGDKLISRQASDMALTAYRIRNDASHTGEADPRNKNIFADNMFTKDHALTSISLIMPLIQDYIKFKSK